MGYYHLELDKLSEYTGRTVEDLKTESYASLEAMIADMQREKFLEQNRKNAQDAEFERLVHKFFAPVEFLSHWFGEKEIVLACARTGVTTRDICQEVNVAPGTNCWHHNAEYIRTSTEAVRQFDKMGRELMESAYMKRDVYRVASQYQHLSHGQVIRELLYSRYPGLAKFGFQFYGMDSCRDYEIYPKNSIYTSVTALLSGDVDWIIHRNREYCRWYNNGRYSLEECEKTFRTDEALELFGLIHDIGMKEKELGHMPYMMLETGAVITANGLITTRVSDSGNVMLLMEKDDWREKTPFKLLTASPYSLERLVCEIREMFPSCHMSIHIGHETDYLMEHAVDCSIKPDGKNEKWSGIEGYIVTNVFGWLQGNNLDITLRINCPELMK